MEVVVLGSGSSSGVRKKDLGRWCDPDDLLNIRTRSSIFIESGNTRLLIDCGPDFLSQIEREQIDLRTDPLTGVLLTHGHPDHTEGSNDLNRLCKANGQRAKLHADEASFWVIRNILDGNEYTKLVEQKYNAHAELLCAHRARNGGPLYTEERLQQMFIDTQLDPILLSRNFAPLKIGEIKITPFLQEHGRIESWGFVIEDPDGARFAYSTDTNRLSQEVLDFLRAQQLDFWIADCGRHDPDKIGGHSYWKNTKAWFDHVQPRFVAVTHMTKRQDRRKLELTMQNDGFPNSEPTFDGARYTIVKGKPTTAKRPLFNPHTSCNKAAAAGIEM